MGTSWIVIRKLILPAYSDADCWNNNVYADFIVRCVCLLAEERVLGFIIPNTLIGVVNFGDPSFTEWQCQFESEISRLAMSLTPQRC